MPHSLRVVGIMSSPVCAWCIVRFSSTLSLTLICCGYRRGLLAASRLVQLVIKLESTKLNESVHVCVRVHVCVHVCVRVFKQKMSAEAHPGKQ